jgi:hypothetical protein
LTGRPPFTGGRPLEILKLVQSYGQGKVELAKVGSLAPEAPP